MANKASENEQDVDISGTAEGFTVEVEGDDVVDTGAAPAEGGKTAPKIEIVDDTPPKDRNRGAPIPAESLTDVTDEDLAGVSEKVRARIQRFTRGYHDERRAKEAALRERQAAEDLARQIVNENRALQQQLADGSKEFISKESSLAETLLQTAQREYKEAFEANDGEKMAKAQADIARAATRLDRAKEMKPLQVVEKPVQTQQPRPVNPKTQAWKESNPWFGQKRAMTAYTLGLHEELVSRGVVAGSDAYYDAIDEDLRNTFPGEFRSQEQETRAAAAPSPAAPARTARSAPVVAPATRSTAPNVVRITKSQAEIARKLGISLEMYAKQAAQLDKENRNG
jgi:hypothetical protein